MVALRTVVAGEQCSRAECLEYFREVQLQNQINKKENDRMI